MSDENIPDPNQAQLKKADQLRLGGNYEQSRTIYHQIIKRNPFLALAKLGLGRVYFETGDLPNARLVLEEFAEFVPDHALANKILAKIYIHFAEYNRARAKLEMVLHMTPEDTTAKKMLAQIFDAGSNEVSSPDDETKKIEPPTNTATIAEIYRSQGHLQEALNIYKNLITDDPKNETYASRIDEIEMQLAPTAIPEEIPTAETEPVIESTAPDHEISRPVIFTRHVDTDEGSFEKVEHQEIEATAEESSNDDTQLDVPTNEVETAQSFIHQSEFDESDTTISHTDDFAASPVQNARKVKLENLLRIVQHNRRGS